MTEARRPPQDSAKAELLMPRLSDSMEDGTVVRWLKVDGAIVRRGEDLVEIETDKATMTYRCDRDGVLEIIASEGDTLPIGALMARVDQLRDPTDAATGDGAPAPSFSSGALPAPVAASDEVATGTRRGGVPRPGGPPGAGSPPLAGPPGLPASAAAIDPASGRGELTAVALSRSQQVIARRTAESRATVPDFTIQVEVDMEGCVALQAELGQLVPGAAATYDDMTVRACALALREHPRANASYRDGRFELHSRVNVGVAVAARDALVVPTVFDADVKSLAAIAQETRELAARVREATVTPPELSGATFTVSSLGLHGVTSFTGVINPPQSAILSAGSVAQRPAVRDGQLVVLHTMNITLACDHRILYGTDAAAFLSRVRGLLERPLALVLAS